MSALNLPDTRYSNGIDWVEKPSIQCGIDSRYQCRDKEDLEFDSKEPTIRPVIKQSVIILTKES